MNERSMFISSHQILDFSNGQQIKSHLHPEPSFHVGSASSFPPSNSNPVIPPSGNMNFDLHHLPEHPDGPHFYGTGQYNHANHPPTNPAVGVRTPSNYFNAHYTTNISGTNVFPDPRNYGGYVDHLRSSTNYRRNMVPFSEHGRGNFSTDGVRGICEGKNDEGIPGNVQHFGSSAGSSTSAGPMNSGNPLIMEGGAGVTRPRSGASGPHMDSAMVHGYNYLPHGSYGGHSFSNGPFPWSGFYFQASNTHGSSELGNASRPGYSEASGSHGSASFLPSMPIMVQQHHNIHPPENISGAFGFTCYPPLMPAPSRVPANDDVQNDIVRSSTTESAEPARRPTGIRMYRPHGRSPPDASPRRRDFPRLRTLQTDEVALLELPNFYEVDYDIENFIDHHRDMRLDIDDMSYEELLALSERIGIVNTGISEDDITCRLKTRLYSSVADTIDLEELPCEKNNDSCIICQDEYEDNDKLGSLECGHEYHADCLKKWLLVKNICPICKSSGLKTDHKD